MRFAKCPLKAVKTDNNIILFLGSCLISFSSDSMLYFKNCTFFLALSLSLL
jgi:hypothetical protein